MGSVGKFTPLVRDSASGRERILMRRKSVRSATPLDIFLIGHQTAKPHPAHFTVGRSSFQFLLSTVSAYFNISSLLHMSAHHLHTDMEMQPEDIVSCSFSFHLSENHKGPWERVSEN